MRRDPTLLILLGLGIAVAAMKKTKPFVRKFGEFLVQTGEEIKKSAEPKDTVTAPPVTPEPEVASEPVAAEPATTAKKPAAKKTPTKPKQSAPKASGTGASA